MALIPPFFLDCVVAIGFQVEPNVRRYVATGFLYGRPVPGEASVFNVMLVTNKHVFAGRHSAWLRFNLVADEPANEFFVSLVTDADKPSWCTDDDRDVDLAVLGLNGEQLVAQRINFAFFERQNHVLTLTEAKAAGVSEGDGVFALAFPLGIIGKQRNYVIVRQGSIARIRDAFVGASSDILVDISIFPGNSGGPVVTRPELTAIEGTTAIRRAALIGVVSSYVPYQDTAVSQQTGRPRIIFEENSGLASVVPADHIISLADKYIATFGKALPPPSDQSGQPETA